MMDRISQAIIEEHFHNWELGIRSQSVKDNWPGCILWRSSHPYDYGPFYSLEKLHSYLSPRAFIRLGYLIFKSCSNNEFVVLMQWDENFRGVRLDRRTGHAIEDVWYPSCGWF